MNYIPKSRSEAKKFGYKKYYTGAPCKNGHIDYRYSKNARCASCEKEWRAKNHERVSLYVRKSNQKLKESIKKWRENNPQKLREYRKSWEKRNPEKQKECTNNWRINNRNKINLYARTRRARVLQADGTHTEADIEVIMNNQFNKCASCYENIENNIYHVDHIYPISKGGSNWPSNLQILCPSCNRKKSAKHPIDWAKENGRIL